MPLPDLHAELIPGRSAAGFTIGMHASKLNGILSSSMSIARQATVAELMNNTGVLAERSSDGALRAVFFGADQVRLVFNAMGHLYCIFVFDGYLGSYQGRIRIGSPLKLASLDHALDFNQGDEMSYLIGTPGIAFSGTACALEEDPEQLIYGISIHDWALK